MRKVDPNLVVDEFRISIQSARADWNAIDGALAGVPVAVRRKAATDAFFQLAVTWESFMSDWWISAINRDATAFVAQLEARLREHAGVRMGLQPLELSATLVTKKHLNLEAVRRLVDPNGSNIVFHSLADLKREASRQLEDPYKSQIDALTSGT